MNALADVNWHPIPRCSVSLVGLKHCFKGKLMVNRICNVHVLSRRPTASNVLPEHMSYGAMEV